MPTIVCPGGVDSQTGTAVRARYSSDISIVDCGKIDGVIPLLATNDGPYVLPIWNSHQGEVQAAKFVWDLIETAKIKITDVWAKRIWFWFLRRKGASTSFGKIGSVVVAKTQCSVFLKEKNCQLVEEALTTIAFAKYQEGANWDGVLVAEGQGEGDPGYEVVAKETANSNNFTSFVRFVPSRVSLSGNSLGKAVLTGVSMPSFGASLGDTEQAFFDQLLGAVTDLNDIPKLLFVFKRVSKVGLLFEGSQLHAGDLLDAEELESGEISVFEDAGVAEVAYTEEVSKLFAKEFAALCEGDFILHRGVNTCLFACPPLALYTHGYEVETVEPVFRFYISKLFQIWEDGASCNSRLDIFFTKHRKSWLEHRSQFIRFKEIYP
jgi:Prephenate dehydratase